MYFLVDIIAIAFVLGFTIYGLKVGFFKSTMDVLLLIVCLAGAGVLSYFTAKWFDKIGWVAEFQSVLAKLFGNSKISGGQPIIDLVCYWISFSAFILLSFIVEYVVLNILRKIIVGLFKKINGLIVFGFFDKLLGMAVNFAITAGIVLGLMALFYALARAGKFSYGDEVIRASEVLSYIHKINPLNKIILGMFGA